MTDLPHDQATREALLRAELILQMVSSHLPTKERKKIHRAMETMNGVHAIMRRKAIFQTGAQAATPKARFDDQELGSSESMTFYDGFASTHHDFKNPYRGGRNV